MGEKYFRLREGSRKNSGSPVKVEYNERNRVSNVSSTDDTLEFQRRRNGSYRVISLPGYESDRNRKVYSMVFNEQGLPRILDASRKRVFLTRTTEEMVENMRKDSYEWKMLQGWMVSFIQ